MPSIDWDGLGLSRRYMRKAREEADKFLGNDPPLWDKLGMDTRLEKVGSYLEHLRKTDNSYIAEKLLSDENAAMELLRQKIKYIRNTKKKGSSCFDFYIISSADVLQH